jgi:hypothetical protein
VFSYLSILSVFEGAKVYLKADWEQGFAIAFVIEMSLPKVCTPCLLSAYMLPSAIRR